MMNSGRLTERERIALTGIEAELRDDARLDRALATMQNPATLPAGGDRNSRSVRAWTRLVWLFVALGLCVLVAGAALQVTAFVIAGVARRGARARDRGSARMAPARLVNYFSAPASWRDRERFWNAQPLRKRTVSTHAHAGQGAW